MTTFAGVTAKSRWSHACDSIRDSRFPGDGEGDAAVEAIEDEEI